MVRNISHASGRIAAAVAGIALVATTAACGGSNYTQAQKNQVAQGLASSGMPISHSQAQCMAGKILDSVSLDTLKKYGLTSGSSNVHMTTDDANKVADAMTSCANLVNLFANQSSATPKQKACMKAAITQQDIHTVLVDEFTGHPADANKLPDRKKAQACKNA